MIALEQILKSAQASFLRGFTEISNRVSAQVGQVLIREAQGEDNIVPIRRIPAIQQQAQDILLPVFVDDSDRPYAEDNVTPTSEYSSLLNRHVISVIVGVIHANRKWAKRNTPDDVFTWMLRRPLGYRPGGPFRSNPLATYDPFHFWIDPRGYNLSQRIWNVNGNGVGQRTLADLNSYLDWNIRRGTSALTMSRELERFLRPQARLKQTDRPYGTTTSYHGMVLARSEIARAHAEATFMSARANPYVTGMEWKLSARHPKVDICDRLATLGMQGQRLKEPYPLDSAPQIVRDSHPQCLCSNFPSTEDTASVTEQVRAVMSVNNAPPYTTPWRMVDFAAGMLGAQLLFEIQETVTA